MLVQIGALVAGSSMLLMSAGCLTACLRLRSGMSFLLATNLLAWSLTIGFLLALSPAHLVERWTTWSCLGGCLAFSLGAWSAAGRPSPPLCPFAASLRSALHDPAVATLAVLAGLGLAYAAALAVGTPENEGDPLVYHVARAALWYQQHAVAYVHTAVDPRVNGNPPNAEIGDLLTMLLTGSQRYVGLVQLGASVVLATATSGVARRLRLPSAAAAFSGLIVLSFPVVITQTWTALNDIVVAAFLVTAVYFVLGDRRIDLGLAGLAAGLAVGTKFVGLLSLPVVVLVALAAPGRRTARAASLLAGAAVTGSTWYVVNLVETGKLDGGLGAEGGNRPAHVLAAVPATLRHFALGAVDLSGSPESSWVWFGLVGVAMATFALKRPDRLARVIPGISVAIAPAFVDDAYRLLSAAWPSGGQQLNTTAGAIPSWYGPLGVGTLFIGTLVAVRPFRRRRYLPMVLALAPVALAICFAFTIAPQHGQGRYFMFAFALGTATVGLGYRHRGLVWAMTAIGGATLVLSLVTAPSKPSGLSVLGVPGPSPSVWGRPDWWTQSILRPETDDRTVLRFFQQRVPAETTVALALRNNDFVSPYFGPRLQRHIELVRSGAGVAPDVRWLLAAPGVKPAICTSSWRSVLRTRQGWVVARRIGDASSCHSAAFAASHLHAGEKIQHA